jgi:hypothetical protein
MFHGFLFLSKAFNTDVFKARLTGDETLETAADLAVDIKSAGVALSQVSFLRFTGIQISSSDSGSPFLYFAPSTSK